MREEEPTLEGLFRFVATHPVAVGMLFVAAAVFGYVSYERLALNLMPDISYPTLTVRTDYEGAAPQEVEQHVSRPVEEALATLDGLVAIDSRSRAGQSDVVLSFDWGTNMDEGAQSVREALQTTFFVDGVDRPLLLRYDPSLDPFLRVTLAMDPEAPAIEGTEGLYLLRSLAEEEIKRALEAMDGVAAVRVRGGLEREIRVEVVEDWLAARQVTLAEVTNTLTVENVNQAGGSILEGDAEYLIRTLNQFRSIEDIEAIAIRRSDGTRVPLTDVARVIETHTDREVVSHLDGQEAVELEIFKEADANVVEVSNRVRIALMGDPDAEKKAQAQAQWGGGGGRGGWGQKSSKSIKETLPDGVVLEILEDQAEFIEDALTNLRQTALLGGFLAVLVLYLFLRDFRTTAVVGLAIPVSIICTFAPLYLFGTSLNLMSLGGLALGIGMLVDNAVVVLESIQRYRELGRDRLDAAVEGTSDVAAAVTASTLTTVAVFFPIAFVEGVAGELFGDLSMAVVSSLLASLVTALFLVPMLAALDFGSGKAVKLEDLSEHGPSGAFTAWATYRAWVREGGLLRKLTLPFGFARFLIHLVALSTWTGLLVLFALVARVLLGVLGLFIRPVRWLLDSSAGVFQAAYQPLARRYGGVLGWSLRHPATILSLAGVALLASWAGAGQLGSELLPEVHQGRFTIEASFPVGTPLSSTVTRMDPIETLVASHPQVARVYSAIGADDRADARADEGEHTARLLVRLTPGGDLASREAEVMEDLRRALLQVPDLGVKMTRPTLFSFSTPIEVVVFGRDLDQLRDVGDRVAKRLSEVEGLRDVRSSLVSGYPEIQITYDRDRLQRFSLDTSTAAAAVRDKVQGAQAKQIDRGTEQLDVLVRLVENDRATLTDLRRINVNPEVYPVIPLDAVAELREAEGPSEIRRVDQQRATVISANLEGFDLGAAVGQIEGAMLEVPLPEGVSWEVDGQARELESSASSMVLALSLAVFLVYVIMASTFENLLHPFVILFSVPLAVVGVVGMLAVTGTPLSVVVFIGAIVLAGVVVNNAIVLVDTVNRLRETGLSRMDALRAAGELRLRPILITTATTVLGLLPLGLGIGAGAEVQQPLALTLIAGLSSSTLLTLVVIPVVYRVLTRRSPTATSEPASAEASPAPAAP